MMNGKVRAFNGDMGMAMSVFKDMVGKVRFVFADPPYKITQTRYDKEGFDYKAMWEVIQKNAVSVRGGSRHLFPHGGGRDHEGRPSGMVPVRPCLA